MKLYNITKQFLALVILSMGTFVASATPVTMNFTGTLTDSFDILHSGDAFSGSYTYDPSIAGIPDIFNPSVIVFDNLLAASVTVFSSPGIASFSATYSPGVGFGGGIFQWSDWNGFDSYQMGAGNNVGSAQIGGLDISGLNVNLFDSTMAAITDPLTLLNPPSLSSFEGGQLNIVFGDYTSSDPSRFGGVIGNLETLSVPEPGSLFLLGAAAVSFRFARRRNKQVKG